MAAGTFRLQSQQRVPRGRFERAVPARARIFNFIGALWASAGITVSSILIGGGFFRSDAQANSAKHQPATV
jgi:hypothetical protein